MKRTYNTNWTGLCNRLESLIIAQALQDRFGHEMCVDWPELDALQIAGAHRADRGLLGRFFGFKLRDDTWPSLEKLERRRHVVIRGYNGPSEFLEPALPRLVEKLQLHPELAAHIRGIFAQNPDPVVGVHLRRGDYGVASDKHYDVRAIKCMALPDWLLEHAMTQVQTAYPKTRFFISYTGDAKALPEFLKGFDWFDIQLPSPYGRPLLAGHASSMHPVADLFALACCTTVIATPCSSFSHWSANVLGTPATTLLPMPGTLRAHPQLGICRLGRVRLSQWTQASRHGTGVVAWKQPADLPPPQPAQTDWL